MLKFEGMYYSVKGNGMPILLLHGWGVDSSSFAIIANELSVNYRVFALDLWGFGKSDSPLQDATIFDYSESVYRFVQQVISEPTILLGHSFGGRICLILGSRPLIKDLILVDSAGLKPKLSFWQKRRIFRYKKLRNMVIEGKKNSDVLNKFGSHDYRNASGELRQVFVRVVNQDLLQFAQSVNKPTLIIWGKSDKTTPPRMARKLHTLIVRSQLQWIKGGHFSYLDSPREFLTYCYEFLNNLEKRDV